VHSLRYAVLTNVFMLGLVTVVSCSSKSSSQSQVCVPNETRSCVGPGACNGVQACAADGNSWSPCNCGSAPLDGGQGGAGAGNGATGGSAQVNEVLPNYVLIDDMEGTSASNGPIKLDPGVAGLVPGYWGDWRSTGNASNTMAPDPLTYSVLSTPHTTLNGVTSTHAVHLKCLTADLYGYCEAGMWLVQREGDAGTVPDAQSVGGDVTLRVPYDVSAHHGIVFWGISSAANQVKVMFNNVDTDVFGDKCGQSDAASDQCWDSFSKYVKLTDTWQKFEVKFSDLSQEGWGYAVPSGKFDATTVYKLSFVVNGPASASAPAVTADIWIDDIYFE